MKETVKSIKRCIMTIGFGIILIFRVRKYSILCKLDKIDMHVYKCEYIFALHQFFYSLIIHDVLDENDAIKMYKEATDKL